MLADSERSNKIINTPYVHDIMKAERRNSSLLEISDGRNRIKNIKKPKDKSASQEGT